MAQINIEVLEIAGFYPTFAAMRLPHGHESKATHNGGLSTQYIEDKQMTILHFDNTTVIPEEDIKLLSKLVKAGDEHAKAIRGIMVWVAIKAPIWWYREMETYRIGRERLSSESTMHIDCKGLSGEELEDYKDHIEMGKIQRTVDVFSYQTLRRIYAQRKDHRLPMWHTFCHWIETLPFSSELITIDLRDE